MACRMHHVRWRDCATTDLVSGGGNGSYSPSRINWRKCTGSIRSWSTLYTLPSSFLSNGISDSSGLPFLCSIKHDGRLMAMRVQFSNWLIKETIRNELKYGLGINDQTDDEFLWFFIMDYDKYRPTIMMICEAQRVSVRCHKYSTAHTVQLG